MSASRAERDARYNQSDKGRARQARYNRSNKGWARNFRYERTAAGLRRKVAYDKRDGHWTHLQDDRLAERERYEASGSDLSFIDWLNLYEPLPKLPRIP